MIAQLSETVVDLLVSGDTKFAEDAAFELLDELTPIGEPDVPRGSHSLCVLFEAVALGLGEILDAPSMVIDEIIGDEIKGYRALAVGAKALLRAAVNLSLKPATAPLEVVYVQACGLAVMLCPNTKTHTSLEKNCTPTAARALIAEAWTNGPHLP